MSDEAAEAVYATPDLLTTGTFESDRRGHAGEGWLPGHGKLETGTAVVCTAIGSRPRCTTTDDDAVWVQAIVPASDVQFQDDWRAAGMAGTATNTMSMENVFVPTHRVIAIKQLADGDLPRRRYSDDPYYNRPWVMLPVGV